MDRLRTRTVVVVTGGTAGVGRAIARRFAADGAAVAVLARGEDGLAATAADIAALGGLPLALRCDVADAEQVFAAADLVERELGPIDIWINNAVTTVVGPVDALTPAELQRVTDVSYHGYVWGTQAALRAMRPRNRGTIVQIGSALAHRGLPLQAAASGAKHAIRGFTDAVRSELLHDGVAIDLTMVQLPAVNTPQYRWCENKLDTAPQPVPPIFQPELIAEQVHLAALHPRREVYLGLSTIKAVLGQKVMPGWLDRRLARRGYRDQRTGWRPRRGPSNLFEAVAGDHGARGEFSLQARSRDGVAAVGGWLGAAGVRALATAGAVATVLAVRRLLAPLVARRLLAAGR